MKSIWYRGGAAASLALVVCACATQPSNDRGSSGSERNGDTSHEAVGTSGAPSGSGAEPAMLRVRLVDAPTGDVTAVFVTIAKVDASIGGEWRTVADGERTVDLLTLQDGAFLDLGGAELPSGHVDQIRLHLAEGGDHHVVTAEGEEHALRIPSGEESGIKLVGGFDLAPCSTTQITIDFDAKKSVSLDKNSGGWRMRPVVRIKALVSAGTCEEPSTPDASADASENAPLEDPCAAVTCAETEVCQNGACTTLE